MIKNVSQGITAVKLGAWPFSPLFPVLLLNFLSLILENEGNSFLAFSWTEAASFSLAVRINLSPIYTGCNHCWRTFKMVCFLRTPVHSFKNIYKGACNCKKFKNLYAGGFCPLTLLSEYLFYSQLPQRLVQQSSH